MSEINWKDKCWVTTIYLIREDKKVLLSWNKNIQTWIPVGGHINPGETPEEAVIREVKEETGIEFEFFDKPIVRSVVRIIKPFRVQIENVAHHNKHINLIFIGKCNSTKELKETDDKEELRWFSKQDILNMKENLLDNVYIDCLEILDIIEKS